jgi:secondary thiamine-phosphate synthase enzyme
MTFQVSSPQPRCIVDITDGVTRQIVQIANRGNTINLVVQHTTCSLLITALSPDNASDFWAFVEASTPKLDYQHTSDPQHSPAHIWSAIIGASLSIPLAGNQLALGAAQRIALVEFDGPKTRNIVMA